MQFFFSNRMIKLRLIYLMELFGKNKPRELVDLEIKQTYFQKNKGKLLTSHRYDRLPLLPSGPGGVQRELVV